MAVVVDQARGKMIPFKQSDGNVIDPVYSIAA